MSNRTVQAAAEGMPSFPGFPSAFASLEGPITRLLRLAETLVAMQDHVFPDCEDTSVMARDNNALTCLGNEVLSAATGLDQTWTDLWSAAPDDIHVPDAVRSVPVAGAAQ